MLSGLADATLHIALGALGYRARVVREVCVLEAEGRGALPTVVLLHGLGSRGADYLPLLQRLRPHARRVIAPDFPGHGASPLTRTFDIATATGALAEALDEALDEPAIVYGNSLGGFAAIRFAATYPDRVAGLFIASPAGAPSSTQDFERFQSSLRSDTHTSAVRFIEKMTHRDPGALRHVAAWFMRRRLAPVQGLVDDMPHAPGLTAQEVASLAMPVHLLWGRAERLLPREHLEFFRANLRNATIEEPPGLGHAPQLDDVEGVARRLVAFGERVSS